VCNCIKQLSESRGVLNKINVNYTLNPLKTFSNRDIPVTNEENNNDTTFSTDINKDMSSLGDFTSKKDQTLKFDNESKHFHLTLLDESKNSIIMNNNINLRTPHLNNHDNN